MDNTVIVQNLINTIRTVKIYTNEEVEIECFYALRSFLERKEHQVKRISIAGVFSSGKSTLVNSILNLKGDMAQKTGLSETTSIPTVIRPSCRDRFLTWHEGMLSEAPDEFGEEIIKLKKSDLTGILKHYFNKEIEFIKEVKMDGVEGSVEYLDLPGSQGVDWKKNKHSIKAGIYGSDGLIYLINGRYGFREDDRQILTDVVPKDMKVVVAITHLNSLTHKNRNLKICKIKLQVQQELKSNLIGILPISEYDAEEDIYQLDSEEENLFKIQNSIINNEKTSERIVKAATIIVENILTSKEVPEEKKAEITDHISNIAKVFPGQMEDLAFLTNLKFPSEYEDLERVVKKCLQLEIKEPVFFEEIKKCNDQLKKYVDSHKDKREIWEAGHMLGKSFFTYLLYLTSPDTKEGVDYLDGAAKKGCLLAQYMFADAKEEDVYLYDMLLEKYSSVSQLEKIQISHLENCAKNNYTIAMEDLADFYYQDDSRKRKLARDLLERAGKLGDGYAYHLITKYAQLQKKSKREYLKKAADAKYPSYEACLDVGLSLWQNKANRGEAIEYIYKAYGHSDEMKKKIVSFLSKYDIPRMNESKSSSNTGGKYLCSKVLTICPVAKDKKVLSLIREFDKIVMTNVFYIRLKALYDMTAPIIIQEIDKLENPKQVWCQFTYETILSVLVKVETGLNDEAVSEYFGGVLKLAMLCIDKNKITYALNFQSVR